MINTEFNSRDTAILAAEPVAFEDAAAAVGVVPRLVALAPLGLRMRGVSVFSAYHPGELPTTESDIDSA